MQWADVYVTYFSVCAYVVPEESSFNHEWACRRISICRFLHLKQYCRKAISPVQCARVRIVPLCKSCEVKVVNMFDAIRLSLFVNAKTGQQNIQTTWDHEQNGPPSITSTKHNIVNVHLRMGGWKAAGECTGPGLESNHSLSTAIKLPASSA